jgi:hypothetical protein
MQLEEKSEATFDSLVEPRMEMQSAVHAHKVARLKVRAAAKRARAARLKFRAAVLEDRARKDEDKALEIERPKETPGPYPSPSGADTD